MTQIDNLLIVWKNFVQRLELKTYTYDDDTEFDYCFNERLALEDETITEEIKKELHLLDERFRVALFPALKKARLVNWYLHAGTRESPEEWWLHIEEAHKHQ